MRRNLSLNRIRTQLTATERMMRMMRAEVESHISYFSPGEVEKTTEVGTGLSTLLREGKPLESFAAQPYQRFYPGVWMGLDQEVGDCGATVALKTLHPHDPVEAMTRVARLSVNPVFPLMEKPRWVTLETATDLDTLRKAKTLRLDMISFFDISPRNGAAVPRHVTLTLRLRRRDGSTSDHLTYRVPVSTMPFEHSMTVNESGVASLDLVHADEATFIIELPLAGEFSMNIDHFSLKAIGA